MSNPEITKHTLNLRSGDWDFIESIFKPRGVATSIVVRSLISRYVDEARKNEQPITKLEGTSL